VISTGQTFGIAFSYDELEYLDTLIMEEVTVMKRNRNKALKFNDTEKVENLKKSIAKREQLRLRIQKMIDSIG
jgi:hypothetical protein